MTFAIPHSQEHITRPARRHRPQDDGRYRDRCERVAASVAVLSRLRLEEVLGQSRTARVTRARHVAMYLANIVFSVPMAGIGRVFGRDRSTVVYACRLIEDERDDPEFDRKLDVMERLIREEEEALHGV